MRRRLLRGRQIRLGWVCLPLAQLYGARRVRLKAFYAGSKLMERFGNSALHFLGFVSAAGWENSSQAVMSSLMYAA